VSAWSTERRDGGTPVRFAAIACDYDGTLASADGLGPETLGALERARGTGLRLILVTGRTFFELTRVCERLDLFDGRTAPSSTTLRPEAFVIRPLRRRLVW
jgi:ribonucleotide monophosphatase NagD (HAD superfamily)